MTPASHREQLNAMLCEAAEIEHSLMCTYLYAAFSLKQSTDEGLSDEELAAVRRWRGEVTAVAIDEMLHLSLVNNLIAAIGERPHYRRFNFPISNGLFPADVAVSLAPFDLDTLDHFVYLERPQSAEDRDGERYAKGSYRRVMPTGRLMAFSDDYTTVGELYETILASFRTLVARYGEEKVFVGTADTQLTRREFALDGLHPIASLVDVERAIEHIVSQGEGSRESRKGSHYARFCAIRSEWQALSAANPHFVPARPAARDPVMRSPVVNALRVHIVEEPAATLLDAGNACYGLMLRLLGALNDPWLAHLNIRPSVAGQSLALMHAITCIGNALTRLPANPAHPEANAGLTFTVGRAALSFVSPDNACTVLAERFRTIAQRLRELSPHTGGLDKTADKMSGFSAEWLQWREAYLSVCKAAPADSMLAMPAPTAPLPAATRPADAPHVEVVPGSEATVQFDHKRCIHARHCVMGEPGVFLANTPGDWINPDVADVERLSRVAHACPSGAINIIRKDGKDEQPPLVNQLRVRENGPLAVHAELITAGQADGYRATLCRCGQSRNKPYCDGSHTDAGFAATGEPATRASDPLPLRGGPLKVDPQRNGPLEVTGNLELLSGTGRTVERMVRVRLCRCGQSRNKPYCDNSHIAAGFEADGA